jgi:isopenicillin N synthase-like dioxygenase
MEAFASALNLPVDFFASKHRLDEPSGTILRYLHYLPGSKSNNGIRAGCHSDYGTLTLLFQDAVGGLQVLLPASQLDSEPTFINVTPRDGCVVVNVGDLLQLWTGSVCFSAQHRVVSTGAKDKDRYSIAFFWHPCDTALIEPLPSDVISRAVTTFDGVRQAEQERMRFISRGLPSPFNAGDFLRHRLARTHYK